MADKKHPKKSVLQQADNDELHDKRPIDMKDIERKLERLRKIIAICEKEAAALPGESLIIRNRGGRNIYFVHELDENSGKRRERYLCKDEIERVQILAQKRYAQNLLPYLKKEASAMEFFLHHYKASLKYQISERSIEELNGLGTSHLDPIEHLSERWSTAEHSSNTYHLEALTYQTQKGHLVRSKSELIIADILWQLDIPYRYEMPLQLNPDSCIYPDFTVMHPLTGDIYYIEFFGMMGEADYALKAFQKITLYQNAQLGARLLYFFEYPNAPLDISAVRSTLKHWFLEQPGKSQ